MDEKNNGINDEKMCAKGVKKFSFERKFSDFLQLYYIRLEFPKHQSTFRRSVRLYGIYTPTLITLSNTVPAYGICKTDSESIFHTENDAVRDFFF